MIGSASHRSVEASCHCGNIRVALDWPESVPTIAARACGCSFCTKHGGVWTSHPDARFWLSIADEGRLTQYQFGTKTADFHVCLVCGVVPIVTCTIEGTRYAVFNVNAFDGAERARVVTTASDFEGEATDDRLARRRRNWTPEGSG